LRGVKRLALALAIAACSAPPSVQDAGAGGGSSSGGGAAAGGGSATGGGSAGGGDAGAPDSGVPDAGITPQWLLPPSGITADELAVLVNTNDPLSVAVADHYMAARHLPPENRIDLAFPVGLVMTVDDFTAAKTVVDARLDGGIQALALTWTSPYRVDCMSVTTAFAAGFDAGAYCSTQGNPCSATVMVPTFNARAHTPFTDFGIRPTMMLAASDAGYAFSLIDRGVSADDTNPTGDGWFFRTTDSARSVRYFDFEQTVQTFSADGGLTVTYVDASDGGTDNLSDAGNVLFYFQSLASVPNIATNTYRPGAVADHLTSYGGQVPTSGQMSCLRWLEAGATASYGTVVEPCNFTQKFPQTSILLAHYIRGEPIIEAYWKSVYMPGEGLFIGEPLARPFGDETHWDAQTQTLTLTTGRLVPSTVYAIESADSPQGPWTPVRSGLQLAEPRRVTLTVQPATAAYYRLNP
jgi:uncharacterized protein (TIGR03790 family)